MHEQYIEQVVDLTEPEANQLYRLSVEQAREIVLNGCAEEVSRIAGSFALVARAGKTVRWRVRWTGRCATSWPSGGRPGVDRRGRIDTIYNWMKSEGLDAQFHPSYTRMVPAHYVVEIQLVGCPDPDPVYTRFFTPVPRGDGHRSRPDRRSLHRRAGGRNREMVGPQFLPGTNRGMLFRRHRQRQRLPYRLPRDAAGWT